MIKVYLDASVYNRPFDDQSHPRIYLETIAFVTIMQMLDTGEIELVSPSVLAFENSKNPFPLRKLWVNDCLNSATLYQKVNESIKHRATQMEAESSIKPTDAFHLACAEAMECDYFLACDDRLVKRYRGNLQVCNPVNFILLLTEKGYESKNGD